MLTDPFSALVVLQLRGEGTDGLLDSSAHRAVPTVAAGPSRVSSPAKYGAGALSLDGLGYASYPAHPAYSFGTRDFTIRLWIYPLATPNPYPTVLTHTNSWTTDGWSFNVDHEGAPGKYVLWNYNFSSSAPMLTSTSSVAYNTWTHVELTRQSNVWRLFINGTLEASTTSTVRLGSLSDVPFQIGSQFLGYIDDLQITIGVARHSANFSPPGTELSIDPLSPITLGERIVAAHSATSPLTYNLNPMSLLARDIEFGGFGLLAGTVKRKDSPVDKALARRVFLLREPEMKLVGTTWSDAQSGHYAFDFIDLSRRYTTLAVDYEHNYRAVVADNLTPEVMP